jgi:peroxiredoxin Q/BCP
MRTSMLSLLVVGALALAAPAQAQDAAPEGGPKVGDLAPDFTLPGSTKDGVLPTPVHLSDFRGQTVVLAFFPKARTKG